MPASNLPSNPTPSSEDLERVVDALEHAYELTHALAEDAVIAFDYVVDIRDALEIVREWRRAA